MAITLLYQFATLWADGFNGVYEHLRDRASFVVTSPDSPEKQQAFASSATLWVLNEFPG